MSPESGNKRKKFLVHRQSFFPKHEVIFTKGFSVRCRTTQIWFLSPLFAFQFRLRQTQQKETSFAGAVGCFWLDKFLGLSKAIERLQCQSHWNDHACRQLQNKFTWITCHALNISKFVNTNNLCCFLHKSTVQCFFFLEKLVHAFCVGWPLGLANRNRKAHTYCVKWTVSAINFSVNQKKSQQGLTYSSPTLCWQSGCRGIVFCECVPLAEMLTTVPKIS